MNTIFSSFLEIFLENPVAQIFGILAMIIITISGVIKDDRKMILVLTLSFAFWAIHFGMLGFYTGASIYAILIVRNISSLKYPKNKILFILSIITLGVAGVITFKDIYSLFPLIATFVISYSLFFSDKKGLRIGLMIGSVLWFAYSIASNSIGGMFTEVLYLGSISIGFFRLK